MAQCFVSNLKMNFQDKMYYNWNYCFILSTLLLPPHTQYFSICSLCSFYWRSICSFIENTDDHMNKLLLFSAAVDTAKSHGNSNEYKWTRREREKKPHKYFHLWKSNGIESFTHTRTSFTVAIASVTKCEKWLTWLSSKHDSFF